MLNKTQFRTKLESAVTQGQKARDIFQMLAVDAVQWFHAEGDSRNDSGRIQLLLLASERVNMINTNALALYFKAFVPVSINDEFGVKFDKARAAKLTEDQRKELTVESEITSFWSYRKTTEKKQSEFDPNGYAQRVVIELVKKGHLTQEQIIELVTNSFHAEKVIKALNTTVSMAKEVAEDQPVTAVAE